ncbi:Non-heme 11 kDa protein of cytochrome bc1 complex [Delitschia confertaspora ATCC 74209]|uniref:Cytochrome b-c1 complex subunit 6, mitochondrial n=1 Tax=Delitschia confertaspora ATCC 74209 TaxID=1513339 RepID=A0A9P4JCY7_9PLEO|nr:Non-heme 11 kDa protein of cytochrome bc1 complex [Delitschia confertaspora ATCC 74209]
MGFTSFLSDVWESVSHPSPDAESPPQGGVSTTTPHSGTNEENADEKEVNKADAEKAQSKDEGEQGHYPTEAAKSDASDDEEAPEEEEEEEEETVDPKEVLEKECESSKECAPAKHHYDECVQRVTGQIENDGKAKEDCVEEFFHLVHCTTACAAPKLFQQLK